MTEREPERDPDRRDPGEPGADRGTRQTRRAERLARLFVDSHPTTAPLPLTARLRGTPYRDPIAMSAPARDEVRRVLVFALDLGETMLRCGAGALDVERSLIAVTAACGLRHVDVDITNQSVVVYYGPPDATPFALLRVARTTSRDFSKLVSVHRLVIDLVTGAAGREEAIGRLEAIRRRPRPFRRWVITLAWGVMAAAVVLTLGGDWPGAAVGFGTAVVIDLLTGLLARAGLPGFFTMVAAGLTMTLIALVLFDAHLPVTPAYVVAGGLVPLLPTATVVGAVQDAINGFPVTAAGRALAALLAFSALLAGIATALTLGSVTGLAPIDIAPPQSSATDLPLRLLLAFLVAACGAVYDENARRIVVPTGLLGALGFGVAALLAPWAGDRLAPAVAAIAMGFAARVAALRLGAPPLVMIASALYPLLPGFLMVSSIYRVTVGGDTAGVGALGLFSALVVVLGLAGGSALGDWLGQPLDRGAGWLRSRRASGRG